MQSIFPLAGAVLVLLEIARPLSKKAKQHLPLGGSHIAQVAVVLGAAFAIYEVATVLS